MNPLARAIMGTAAGAALSPLAGAIAIMDARSGVTDVSGFCSAWADQSGTGSNATQSTAGLRPQIISSHAAFGGAAALYFNASYFSWAISTASKSHTFYFVVDQASVGAWQRYFDTATGRYLIEKSDASGNVRYFDGTTYYSPGTATTGAQVMCVTADATAPSVQFYRNNAAFGSALTYSGGGRAIGGTTVLGASNSGSLPLVAYVAAVFVYPTAHSTGDRTHMHNYITQEWGI